MLFLPSPSGAVDLRVLGLETISVELSGPRRITRGETETFTITFSVRRVREAGVDPANQDIRTAVELLDEDAWFRDGDDLLSHAFVVVPRGEPGSIYEGTVTLQLRCSQGGTIRGVGAVPYGDQKSGEGEAEIYAWFNGVKSHVMTVRARHR